MSQSAVQLQTAPTQIQFKAYHTHISSNTPHTSQGKPLVLRYIRHKSVIDKSLPTPYAFAPFIQPKHLTFVSYSFNIWLAPCLAHHIAPDC